MLWESSVRPTAFSRRGGTRLIFIIRKRRVRSRGLSASSSFRNGRRERSRRLVKTGEMDDWGKKSKIKRFRQLAIGENAPSRERNELVARLPTFLRKRRKGESWGRAEGREKKKAARNKKTAKRKLRGQSGRHDSNVRPLRPERSALARLSYAPF